MLILALLLPHPARMTRALDWSQSSDVFLCHADLQQCGASAAAAATKNSRKILDIIHTLREDLPIWLGEDGLGRIKAPVLSMSRGDDANVSELKLDSVHTGTHVHARDITCRSFMRKGWMLHYWTSTFLLVRNKPEDYMNPRFRVYENPKP